MVGPHQRQRLPVWELGNGSRAVLLQVDGGAFIPVSTLDAIVTDYTDDDLDYISPPPKIVRKGEVVMDMKRAANSRAWALGQQMRNGFHVRRIVWGRLMARCEKRPGEQIRKAVICVKEK